MPKKYTLPNFLEGILDPKQYKEWLYKKAAAHSKGDLKRFNQKRTAESYRNLIHDAVQKSEGKDFYTGESLHWQKVSTYRNEDSKAGKSKYKSGFALLPTLDHIRRTDDIFEFAICGWRTNDAKSDLDLPEMLAFCEKVLIHHGYQVEKPNHAER